jgi:hypothetical protein
MRSGFCSTRFHSDGKRRFSQLISGLCLECRTRKKQTPECKEIERQITLLENRREDIDKKVSNLRYKLRVLYDQESQALESNDSANGSKSPKAKTNRKQNKEDQIKSQKYQQLSINL